MSDSERVVVWPLEGARGNGRCDPEAPQAEHLQAHRRHVHDDKVTKGSSTRTHQNTLGKVLQLVLVGLMEEVCH